MTNKARVGALVPLGPVRLKAANAADYEDFGRLICFS